MSETEDYTISISEGKMAMLEEGEDIVIDRGGVSIKITAGCGVGGHSYEYSANSDGPGGLDEKVSCKHCGHIKFSNKRDQEGCVKVED